MTPAELRRDGGGWLERVGGNIAAAGVATNRPTKGAHRELDYFIVDNWLAHTIERVEVYLSMDIRPHRAVSLVMRQYAESPLRSTIPVAVHHSTNAPPLPRTPSPYISRVSMVPCGGVRQNSLGTLPQAAMPMVTMPMGVMPATGYTCTEWSFGNPRFPQ